jgi:hypothetical protein
VRERVGGGPFSDAVRPGNRDDLRPRRAIDVREQSLARQRELRFVSRNNASLLRDAHKNRPTGTRNVMGETATRREARHHLARRTQGHSADTKRLVAHPGEQRFAFVHFAAADRLHPPCIGQQRPLPRERNGDRGCDAAEPQRDGRRVSGDRRVERPSKGFCRSLWIDE